jgi:hypothetical protein
MDFDYRLWIIGTANAKGVDSFEESSTQIAGIWMNDDGTPLAGTSGVAIGPVTIGRLKNDVQAGLFRNMPELERHSILTSRPHSVWPAKIVS